uniref:Uncharacterized protein n=1 Tax=Oncorhynchus tshawytscha TaxID=74940 RepID=A0A8C8GFI2_ONCTS
SNTGLLSLDSVPAGFYIQRKQIVVVSVRVMSASKREAGARGCVLRNVNINLIGRERGRVVVDVDYIYLNHADLFVVSKYLHGELTFGVPPTQCFPVNALLGIEQPALRVHIDEMRFFPLSSLPETEFSIFSDVAYNRSRSLLFVNGIIQVFQSQGLSPKEKEK